MCSNLLGPVDQWSSAPAVIASSRNGGRSIGLFRLESSRIQWNKADLNVSWRLTLQSGLSKMLDEPALPVVESRLFVAKVGLGSRKLIREMTGEEVDRTGPELAVRIR